MRYERLTGRLVIGILVLLGIFSGCGKAAARPVTEADFIRMADDHLRKKYGDFDHSFAFFTGRSFMGAGTDSVTYHTECQGQDLAFSVTFLADKSSPEGSAIEDSYFPISILDSFAAKAAAAADRYFSEYRLYAAPVIALYDYHSHQDLDKDAGLAEWLATDRRTGSGEPAVFDIVVSAAAMDRSAFEAASAGLSAEWEKTDPQTAPRIALVEGFIYPYLNGDNVGNVYMRKNCLEVYNESQDALLDDGRAAPIEYTGTELRVCQKEGLPVINILQSNEQSAYLGHIMSILDYLSDKYGKAFFYTEALGKDADYYYDGLKIKVYAEEDPAPTKYQAACRLIPASSDIECTDDYRG